MKKIPLTQGKFAIVDDEDYEELSKVKWWINYSGYAARESIIGKVRRRELMHRVINKTPKGFETDHVNMNTLDNRKVNLRTATKSENRHNRKKYASNTSGFKGVGFDKRYNKWTARIMLHGKQNFLGYFLAPELAHAAYCKAAKELHLNFARTK